MRFYRFTLFLLSVFIIASCQFLTEKKNDSEKSEDGTSVIKSYYEKSKALKKEITVKNNKKHGPAKKYYPTGELHTLVHYNKGIKEGETFWYYKNGQAYRVTPYQNGKMHGVRKKYYKDGQLQAEIPYKNGELIEGTEEYKQNGKQIRNNKHIRFEAIDLTEFENKYILKIMLSHKNSKVKFYQEKIATNGNKILVPIKTNQSGTGKIEYILPKGSFKMEILKIYARYKTSLGNPVLISTSYNLAIENR